MSRNSIFALLASLVVAATWAGESGPRAGNPSASEARAARDLFELANQERRQRGLPLFEWQDKLALAARRHAELMARQKTLKHRLPGEAPLMERVSATGLHFDRVAENISYSESSFSAHQGFMRSEGHRANILHPDYNALGVGVVEKGSHIYVAANFARKLEEQPPTEVEHILAGEFNRLREELGRPTLVLQRNSTLRDAACKMAEKDEIEADPGPPQPGFRRVVSFTTPNPRELPKSVRETASRTNLERFAVGACFARTQRYPPGVYWVVMMFYGSTP